MRARAHVHASTHTCNTTCSAGAAKSNPNLLGTRPSVVGPAMRRFGGEGFSPEDGVPEEGEEVAFDGEDRGVRHGSVFAALRCADEGAVADAGPAAGLVLRRSLNVVLLWSRSWPSRASACVNSACLVSSWRKGFEVSRRRVFSAPTAAAIFETLVS